MPASIHNVVFDARQPRLLGRFWAAVTGYIVADERADFVRLRAPDDRSVRQILFLHVADPTPGKNRVHVDLAAPDLEAEIDRLLGLGASLADEPVDGRPRWREGNGIRWFVLRDPEGNEFCVGTDPDGAPPPTVTIELARPEQAPMLQAIERKAGERFRELGMDDVADDAPLSLEVLTAHATGGRAWIALGAAGKVIGYVLVDVVDGCAHVEQVSVLPDHQGTGVGRALLDQVARWAAHTGRPAMTLTTFSHVPWNRPLYEHLGFVVIAEDQIGPELRAIRDAETAHGLDPTTRVCMRRDLT